MGKTNTKQNTKLQLLESGIEIMIEKGYNNTGIMEVLQKTGVPKGSFYYYFDSKEEFGLQIINYFNDSHVMKKLMPLEDKSISPIHRLRNYYDGMRRALEDNECRKGCLIENLSQEMADQSEILRHRLSEIAAYSRDVIAACIAEGQALGEIPKRFDKYELAEFFMSGMKGALYRSKLLKNSEPMQVFSRLMFDDFLKRE
jgi:TetR/AcrR family transcriptional repressor of nem operon